MHNFAQKKKIIHNYDCLSIDGMIEKEGEKNAMHLHQLTCIVFLKNDLWPQKTLR